MLKTPFRTYAVITFLCTILVAVLFKEAQAQDKRVIPVLIVDGFSNHDWKQTTLVTKHILERTGRFQIDVSTVPIDSIENSQWLPQFDKYKVVIQNTNNIHNPNLRWPLQAERALEDYVKNGGGLYILHSANNAFSHWEQYDLMIGMGWRHSSVGYALEIDADQNIVRYAPGEGKSTNHGDRFNALIEIMNRHPINEGYPEAWQTVNTEVYSFPRGSAENITILSYAHDSTDTQKTWPVEWVIAYGKGRVYNSSLGHLWHGEKYPPAYRCVGYQTTVVRAAEWLATGKVTYPIPDSFPSKNAPSLRPEDDI